MNPTHLHHIMKPWGKEGAPVIDCFKRQKPFPTHESNLTSFFGSVHALCSCLCAWHLGELYYLQPQYIQSSCSTATNTINIKSLDQEKSELSAQTSNHIYSSGDTGQPESAEKVWLWTVWDHRVLAAIKAHWFAFTFLVCFLSVGKIQFLLFSWCLSHIGNNWWTTAPKWISKLCDCPSQTLWIKQPVPSKKWGKKSFSVEHKRKHLRESQCNSFP